MFHTLRSYHGWKMGDIVEGPDGVGSISAILAPEGEIDPLAHFVHVRVEYDNGTFAFVTADDIAEVDALASIGVDDEDFSPENDESEIVSEMADEY